jgi:NDP-sugar pyrophosphorylase family protein
MPADLGFDIADPGFEMYAFPIIDYLMEIGTIDRYQAAQAEWSDSAWRNRRIAC